MLHTFPGHRFALAKQIKQTLPLPGKVAETQLSTSHQLRDPDVQDNLLHLQDAVLMKTQSIRHSSVQIHMFNIMMYRMNASKSNYKILNEQTLKTKSEYLVPFFMYNHCFLTRTQKVIIRENKENLLLDKWLSNFPLQQWKKCPAAMINLHPYNCLILCV